MLSKIFKLSHKKNAARSTVQAAQTVQGIAPTPSPAWQNSSRADAALSISSTTLTSLREAAQSSPVPFIRPAAALALAILENIQVFQASVTFIASIAHNIVA